MPVLQPTSPDVTAYTKVINNPEICPRNRWSTKSMHTGITLLLQNDNVDIPLDYNPLVVSYCCCNHHLYSDSDAGQVGSLTFHCPLVDSYYHLLGQTGQLVPLLA